jgi:hypothetical protein
MYDANEPHHRKNLKKAFSAFPLAPTPPPPPWQKKSSINSYSLSFLAAFLLCVCQVEEEGVEDEKHGVL